MNLYYISSGIATIINLFLSALFYYRSKNSRTNLYYALLCLSLAAWTLWDFISVLIPVTHFNLALITCRILYFVIIFLPFFYLKFAFSIAKKQDNPKIFTAVIFFTTALLLSNFSSFFVNSLKIENLTTYSRYIVVEGYFYYLFIALFAFCAIYGVVEIILGYQKASGNNKTQLKYILLASFSAFSASFIYFPTIFGFKIIPIDNVLIIFYTTIIAYAIMQHHLMDIEVVIKKTAIYSILTALLTGIFLSFILVGEFIFRNLTGYSSFWIAILAAFVVALIFQPLRDKIQGTVDKLFFKSKYDYRDTLRNLSQTAVSIIEMDRLLELVCSKVKDTLKTDKASVYLLERDEHSYRIK